MGKPKKLKNKLTAAAASPASTKVKKKSKGKKSYGDAIVVPLEATPQVPASAAPAANDSKPSSAGLALACAVSAPAANNSKPPPPAAAAALVASFFAAPTANNSKPAAAASVAPSFGFMRQEVGDKSSGYIFMCSARTKPDCFRHRVFGMPFGNKDIVLKIKPGTMLFLYDFNLRLMYGIYKASTSGGLNLVPEAWGGNFPAQVKFTFETECLPIPESVFKPAIEENYESPTRFKTELNSQQVHKLLALFRPIPPQQGGPAQRFEERLPSQPIQLPPPAPQPIQLPPPAPQPIQLPPPEEQYRSDLYRTDPYRTDPYKSDLYRPDLHWPGYLVRAPPLDPRYGQQLIQPTTSDPYVTSHYPHGQPSLDPRRAQSAVPPHSDPYNGQPSLDPRYAQSVIPKANDQYYGQPSLDPRHPQSTMLPNDPHYSAPPNDSYQQPEIRHHYPENLQGQDDRLGYRVPPEVANRGEPVLPPARRDVVYRSYGGELVQHAGRPDVPHYLERSTLAAAELPPTQHHQSYYGGRAYLPEGTQPVVSSRANLQSVPVSSLYSFAGPTHGYR